MVFAIRIAALLTAGAFLFACAPRPLTLAEEAERHVLPETVGGFVELCRPMIMDPATLSRSQRIDRINCQEMMRGTLAAQTEWLTSNQSNADDFCLPPGTRLENAAAAFLDWAARHPERHASRDGPFTDAWREAYPCPR